MDTPPCTPQTSWTGAASFERTSQATVPTYSAWSVSESGVSSVFVHDFIDRNITILIPPSPPSGTGYALKDITGIVHTSSQKKLAEGDMCTYIDNLLTTALMGETILPVVRGRSMQLLPSVNTIPTNPKKQPDGSILFNGATVFICELESGNNWRSTTLKLAIHLSQMLSSLRNRTGLSNAVFHLSGFYFPFNSVQCVVEVTVTWSDDLLKFIESHSCIDKVDVPTKISEVYSRNKSLWQYSTNNSPTGFSYPLTKDFLQNNFNGFQVHSGQSIVIISVTDKIVYKKPMMISDVLRVSELMWLPKNDKLGYPSTYKLLENSYFFEYKLYSPPPTYEIIRNCCVWYTKSLVEALKELHTVPKLAHLDVRRENVCMDLSVQNPHIVLIDLDRACRANCLSNVATSNYADYKHPGENEMYDAPSSDWLCENLDWMQLGLLLSKALSSFRGFNHSFICKLKEHGVLDEALLAEFLQVVSNLPRH